MFAAARTRSALWVIIAALLLVVGATLISAPSAAADDSAAVLFGQPSLGQQPPTVRPDCPDDPVVPPGPPDCFDPDHDLSGNALDNLVPRTVVISQGGSVTYVRGGSGRHQVAVYGPGTAPEDIDVSVLSGGFIDDADGRVAKGPLPTGAGWTVWTTPPGTFAQPGRYLVICTFAPHFEMAMYGWVIVK
jgi:plastocyanin